MKCAGGVMSLVLCAGGSSMVPKPARTQQRAAVVQFIAAGRAQLWPCERQTQSIIQRQCLKRDCGEHPLWKLPVVHQEEIQVLLLSCFTAGSANSLKTSLKGSWKNLAVNIKAKVLNHGQSLIYEQHPNTLGTVILGMRVSGCNCINSCKKRWF